MIALTLARKPLVGTVAQNVLLCGTGVINVDGSRVAMDSSDRAVVDARSGAGFGSGISSLAGIGRGEGAKFKSAPNGRWPANLILSSTATSELDKQSGQLKSAERQPSGGTILNPASGWNPNSMVDTTVRGYSDSGGASRFFKTFGDPTTG